MSAQGILRYGQMHLYVPPLQVYPGPSSCWKLTTPTA
jgi:hypothetical protein